MSPKVSVLLPVYNGIHHLGPAISSVLQQSYTDFEVLVIDDGSTEDVSGFLSLIDDSRLKWRTRENKGLGTTLNELIEWSQGEYLARMDADDVCDVDRFRKQVEYLDANSDVVMVGGQINFLVDGRTEPSFPMPLDHLSIRSGLLQARFPICHPALMFRRKACVDVGGYRLGGAGEDLDFFLRISELGQVRNLSDVVLNYRIQNNSLSMRKQSELNKGYAFALHCTKARASGCKEVGLQEFERLVWERRGALKVALTAVRNFSERIYRNSIVARCEGQRLKSRILLGVAGFLRPRTSCERLFQLLRRKM